MAVDKISSCTTLSLPEPALLQTPSEHQGAWRHATSNMAKLIVRTAETLQAISHDLRVEWIPGHAEVEGNEDAHQPLSRGFHNNSLRTWSVPPQTSLLADDPDPELATLNNVECEPVKPGWRNIRPSHYCFCSPHLRR